MPVPGPSSAAAAPGSPDIDALRETPAWLPLEVAPGDAFRVVRLTESDYRAASFLDARLLQSHPPEARCPHAALAAAAARCTPNAQFLFHVGHVGSTLLSRLLGEHPAVFSLREPTLLRTAALQGDSVSDGFKPAERLGILSRTWHPAQRALIKTTSFVNEIGARLLACSDASRALLLFTPAPTYLRAILAGPNSRLETRALAPSRLERVRRRTGLALPAPRQEGEWVALSWLCEMTALAETAAEHAARVRWMDFEQFLREPVAGLAQAMTFIGAEPEQSWVEQLLAGPLMRSYSKAPEHAYDPALRRAILAQADREHAREIRAGLEWLERLATAHPLIAAAMRH